MQCVWTNVTYCAEACAAYILSTRALWSRIHLKMFLGAFLRLLNAKAKVGSKRTSRWTPYPEQMLSACPSNASNPCGSHGRRNLGILDGLGIEPRVGGHPTKILSKGIIWLPKTPLLTCRHLQLLPLHLSSHNMH